MNHADKVLQLVRQAGPVVPSQISKEIGTDILLASAVLSDLVSQNKLKISSVKFGGSPLYYFEDQEEQLQKYIGRLQEKEQKAVYLLMESKVLRDSSLDVVSRYALRQAKDFAKPLEVTANGSKEIFWKWYLLPTKEAEPYIKKELMKPKEDVREEARKEAVREIKKEDLIRPLSELIPKQQVIPPIQATARKEPEIRQQSTKLVAEIKPQVVKKPSEVKQPQDMSKLSVAKQLPVKKAEKIVQPAQKAVKKQVIKPEKPKSTDNFLDRINDFFRKNNIEVVEQMARKKAEAEFIIKVPSAVGHLQYFCKAKDKKSCNEADLSEAYVQGQLRKLPVLFIATSEPTKQAQLLLGNDQINISFRKV